MPATPPTPPASGNPATDEWYAGGLRFTCTQCGNCCTGPPGYVWCEDDEAEAIAKHLKLSLAEFRRRFARRQNGHWTLQETPAADGKGFDCVFLRRDTEGKALCSIYPVRPTQCRTWPFWPENLASPRHWQRASRNCPGMDKGRFFPVEQVRVLRDEKSDV
jgi:hypothetical protein